MSTEVKSPLSTRAKVMRLLGAVLVILAIAPWLSTSTATADPPPAGGGTIHVKAGSLADHQCNETEWHFIINQIDEEANAPASIHVTFSDGVVDIPLEKFTGGAAHYTLVGQHLNATVIDATATIYEDWSGEFVLSHGPCGTTETTPPVTTTPPGETTTPPPTTTTPPPTTTTPPPTTTTPPPTTTTPPVTTTPPGTTSVLPTKIGNTPESSVLGTKTGALADTGLDLSLGAALGLSLALLLAGGSLMALPSRMAVERKRRH
jgi:hypothetical protein